MRRRLWIPAALIALACLVPPWQHTFQPAGAAQTITPAGFAPVFSPPEPASTSRINGVEVDWARFSLVIVAILALCGWPLAARTTPRQQASGSRPEKVRPPPISSGRVNLKDVAGSVLTKRLRQLAESRGVSVRELLLESDGKTYACVQDAIARAQEYFSTVFALEIDKDTAREALAALADQYV